MEEKRLNSKRVRLPTILPRDYQIDAWKAAESGAKTYLLVGLDGMVKM